MTNMTILNQQGKIGLFNLLLLTLLATAVYGGYRIIPLYYERQAFHDQLLRVAGQATLNAWDDRKIMQKILELARKSNFEVERDDIYVRRTPYRAEVTIEVHYRKSIQLPGGHTHVLRFHSVAEGRKGI